MNDEEVRVTSETGGEKGQKLARLGGADPGALLELARVYGYGEGKYARYNYLKGYPWSLSVDALFRHLLAFLDGEDRDPESGLLHTAHAAWHALTLTAYAQKGIGTDDRAPRGPADAEAVLLRATELVVDSFNKGLITRDAALTAVGVEPGYVYNPISHTCDHPEGRRYISVAGTVNCAKCYMVLEDPNGPRAIAPWGDC